MFKHIDNKIHTDSGITNFTYYKAKDVMGRKWVITQFSLSGIWKMKCASHKCKTVYVQSLSDADILLGGGTVKINTLEKAYIDDAMHDYTYKQMKMKTTKYW